MDSRIQALLVQMLMCVYMYGCDRKSVCLVDVSGGGCVCVWLDGWVWVDVCVGGMGVCGGWMGVRVCVCVYVVIGRKR